MGVQTQPRQIRKGGFLRPPLKPHWTQNFTHSPGKGKSKELPLLITHMSFNSMKDYLSSSTILFDGKGNKRWCEIPKKQHTIAESLGFPDLYKVVPSWGPK